MPRRLDFVKWLVRWWSEPNGIVLDPFMGSGTTGVAAAKLGRQFIGIEIVPKFFDFACHRIEQTIRQADMFIVRKVPVLQGDLALTAGQRENTGEPNG